MDGDFRGCGAGYISNQLHHIVAQDCDLYRVYVIRLEEIVDRLFASQSIQSQPRLERMGYLLSRSLQRICSFHWENSRGAFMYCAVGIFRIAPYNELQCTIDSQKSMS